MPVKSAPKTAKKSRSKMVDVSIGSATYSIPPSEALAIKRLAIGLARGKPLRLVLVDEEVTTEKAAEVLNVSRPYVIKLTEQGVLSVRLTGNRRMIPLKEVTTLRDKMRKDQARAMAKLSAFNRKFAKD
jgi:excisionase family DNA binding protein